MSLFNDASLVMIPSGYKNGKVYSVKPTDGAGDLTFTRASNATRVASNGLIEKVRTNLALYSQEFDNAYWSKVNGGTGVVPVVTANTTAAPDGTTTADTIVFNVGAGTTTSDQTFVRRTFTTTIGVEYGNSIYLKGSVGGEQIVFRDAEGGYTLATLTTSWQRIEDVATATGASYNFEFGIRQGLSGIGTINATATIYAWGAQLEQGDIATDYIATTSAAVSVGPVSGLPRLDYLNSSCPRLILEPQRSNLALWSENFNNAYWSKTAGTTITANTTISPDGYQNADTIAFAGSGDSINLFTTTGLSVVSGTTYTFSVFTKSTTQVVFFGGATGGTGTNVYNGAVDYGNGWYRQSVTRTWSASGTVSVQLVLTLNAAGSTILYGFQAELGAYATSYIPTLGTSVTRVADAASKTGISSLIGQTEGTFLVDFIYSNTDTSVAQIFSISDGGATNRVYIGSAFSQSLQSVVTSGGTAQANIGTSFPMVLGQRYRAAMAYKENDFAFYVNGVQIGTDNAGTIPAMNYISNSSGGGSSPANYPLNQMLLFKTRLTDAQLAELTTL